MSLENLLRIRPKKKKQQRVTKHLYLSASINLSIGLTCGVDVKEVNRCADDSVEHVVVQILS